MTMFIREGASTIAAAVVRKAAIHFVRLVSLYHTIAGTSYCCADQPLVLMFTASCRRRNLPSRYVSGAAGQIFIRKTSQPAR